jgi:hypothetical protein
MKLLLPIAAMICTAITTLTAVVFCMGGGANASPAQIRELKLWMAGLSLLGLGGIVASIFLIRAGQNSMAAGVAIAPTVIIILILFVALIK